ISLRKRQDLPSSWGTPIVRLHLFHTDAGRTADTRPLQCRDMALGHRTAKAPAKGLSTLNSMAFGLAVYASWCGLPRPTQNSLPVAGQALAAGLSTPKVPMKGFRSASYISSSLPKFSWRNRCDLRAFPNATNLRRCFGPKQARRLPNGSCQPDATFVPGRNCDSLGSNPSAPSGFEPTA